MKGIYNYIPEISYVCRAYGVASVLSLPFMLYVMLFPTHFYVSTFRSMCVVPKMAVLCSSLMSCFPGMLLFSE
jgi:hypothetical protein